jgi:hypothetical protein
MIGRDNEFYSNSNHLLPNLLHRNDDLNGGGCYKLV